MPKSFKYYVIRRESMKRARSFLDINGGLSESSAAIQYFDTREAAEKAARVLFRSGIRALGIGCRELICGDCGKSLPGPYGTPGVSMARRDNKTLLCSDCGTREALANTSLPTLAPAGYVEEWAIADKNFDSKVWIVYRNPRTKLYRVGYSIDGGQDGNTYDRIYPTLNMACEAARRFAD